jgi:hypothetical protein
MLEKEAPLSVNVLAMILCESVSVDPLSGKEHLHGPFGVMVAESTPLQVTFVVYMILSEVRTSIRAALKIADVEGNVIVEAKPMDFHASADPMLEVEFSTNFVDVVLPDFGHYFVQLWVNGRYIMDRRMVIVEPPEQEETS